MVNELPLSDGSYFSNATIPAGLGDLVAAAKADLKFPKDGRRDDVRARLREVMAEGDMFEAVDDAETDWAVLWRAIAPFAPRPETGLGREKMTVHFPEVAILL